MGGDSLYENTGTSPMTGVRNARDLPGSVPYIALAGLFVASLFAFPLYEILPAVPLVVSMGLLAVGLYWLIAMVCLRSEPRIWWSRSAWRRANLKPLATDERDELASALRDELAPRLQRELMIMAATGAAMGTMDFGGAGMVVAIVLAALCSRLAGSLLDLRRSGEKD